MWFVDSTGTAKDHYSLFDATIDKKEDAMHVGRYVDINKNTYYGWLQKDLKMIFIPRDNDELPQVADKDVKILVHSGIRVV